MLLHDLDQVVQGLVAEEDLSLPVLHIALQIERRRFVDAEILQGLGDGITHFLGDAEEMVDGVSAREDDAGVFRQLDVFLAKFARGDVFEFDEFLESKGHAKLFCHVTIGCFGKVCGLWLRHQNGLNLHSSIGF